MLRPKLITAILFAMLTLGCGGDDSPTSTVSNPTSDAVDNIVNSSNKATYTNYWHVDLGSTTGTSDWAFFADGTGTYYQSFLAPQTVDFTWTKLGSDALLVSISVQTFTNFSTLNGSISNGTFTVILDGNPTARTFVLTAGQM